MVPYLGSSFRGDSIIGVSRLFHMPSQEGGVNINAVIWNIMLFCMMLPYAYDSAYTPYSCSPVSRLLWLKTISLAALRCALRKVRACLLLLVVMGLGI